LSKDRRKSVNIWVAVLWLVGAIKYGLRLLGRRAQGLRTFRSVTTRPYRTLGVCELRHEDAPNARKCTPAPPPSDEENSHSARTGNGQSHAAIKEDARDTIHPEQVDVARQVAAWGIVEHHEF
jgi:hypothetical protein